MEMKWDDQTYVAKSKMGLFSSVLVGFSFSLSIFAFSRNNPLFLKQFRQVAVLMHRNQYIGAANEFLVDV